MQTVLSKSNNIFSFFVTLFLAIFLSVSMAQGQSTTNFAQFFQQTGGPDFVFTNNTSSANFNTVVNGSRVFFIYQNLPGLPAELQGIQSATMYITTTTTQPGTNTDGIKQPFNQIMTVQIIRDTPAVFGGGPRTNLLTAEFSPSTDTPEFSGAAGGNSGTLSASTPNHIVTFSSDFLLFGATISRNLGLSFSAINPTVNLGNGNFLQAFTASASGTFASNPPPTPWVLTSAPASISGSVMTAEGRMIRNASVILTQADGTTRIARTNHFGRFQFQNIPVGQTLIVSVSSKRFSFPERVVNLESDITELNFIADL